MRIDQALAGLGLFAAAALLSSPVRAEICFGGSTNVGGPSISCAESSVSGLDNAGQTITSVKLIPDTIIAGTASSSTAGGSGAFLGTAAATASPGLLSAFASSQAGSANVNASIDARATATFNDGGIVGSTSGATPGTLVVIPFTYQLTGLTSGGGGIGPDGSQLVVGNLLNTSTNGTYFLTLFVGETIDFLANLSVAADANAGTPVSVADFSHTLHIFIDVPDGFTFNTVSGHNYSSSNVGAVPEPSTWAMLLIGFAGIGFMAYRRKSKPALMAA
jgi:PEP-CTERM motif